MKLFLNKYGFWILALGIIAYVGYRKWPHAIDIQDIHIYNDQNQLENLRISGDSALIVHFFASWCGPCMKELPEWNDHVLALREAGFQVICITDDTPEILQKMRERFPNLPLERTESLNGLDVFSIPMTYLYDDKGKQKDRIAGPLDWTNPQIVFELKNKLKHE
jgi:thiol-disulfide isomerase/thioredoxin